MCFSDTWLAKLSTWRLILVLTPYTLVITFILAVFAATLILYVPSHLGTSPKQYDVGRLPGPSSSINLAHDLTFYLVSALGFNSTSIDHLLPH
jgi:hypothetical protein